MRNCNKNGKKRGCAGKTACVPLSHFDKRCIRGMETENFSFHLERKGQHTHTPSHKLFKNTTLLHYPRLICPALGQMYSITIQYSAISRIGIRTTHKFAPIYCLSDNFNFEFSWPDVETALFPSHKKVESMNAECTFEMGGLHWKMKNLAVLKWREEGVYKSHFLFGLSPVSLPSLLASAS